MKRTAAGAPPANKLLPNQKAPVGQVFVIGGMVVTLPKTMKLLLEAPAGMCPWVDWESAKRLGIECEAEMVGKVSLRPVA